MRHIYKYLLIIIIIIGVFIISDISIFKKETKDIDVYIKGDVENDSTINSSIGKTYSDIKDKIQYTDTSKVNSINENAKLYDQQTINIESLDDNKISINNATIEELCKLNGIGEKTAQQIIDYRNTYGPFEYIEEIMEVKGIGEAKFNKIKEYITL